MQNDDACMAVVTLYNFVRLCITYIDWYPFELGLQRNWTFFLFSLYTRTVFITQFKKAEILLRLLPYFWWGVYSSAK